MGIASHRLTQIPGLLRLDGSPPLFYVLLHFWMQAFGSSEVSTHLLPLLTSLLLIPLAWWCARTLFGRRAARVRRRPGRHQPLPGLVLDRDQDVPARLRPRHGRRHLAVRAIRDRSGRDAVGAVLVFAALIYTHNWGLYVLAATAAVLSSSPCASTTGSWRCG